MYHDVGELIDLRDQREAADSPIHLRLHGATLSILKNRGGLLHNNER